MTCILCTKNHWETPASTVFVDEQGKEYCIFHAPSQCIGKKLDIFKDCLKEKINFDKNSTQINLSGTIFPNSFSFDESFDKIISKPIYFSKVFFGGNIDFSNFIFQDKVDFSESEFQGSLSFNKNNFQSILEFKKSKFKSNVFFSNNEFQGKVYFNSNEFEGDLEFLESKFYSGMYVGHSSIHKSAKFSQCEYSEYFTFTVNKVYGKMDFKNCSCKSLATFQACLFEKEADFNYLNFFSGINMKWAEFKEKVSFYKTSIEGEAIFSGAKFSSKAIFRESIFKGNVFFNLATVRNFFDFLYRRDPNMSPHVEFLGEADFSEASFIGKVYFNGAVFSNTSTFQAATFYQDTVFNNSYFSKTLCFDKSTIIERLSIWNESMKDLPVEGEISFRNSIINKEVKITNANLRGFNPYDVDLSKFSFNCCMWKYDEVGNNYIFDEKDSFNCRDYEKQEFIYRTLKKKSIDECDQFMASNWHYQERLASQRKFMTKENLNTNEQFFRFFLNLYNLCSGYGENPRVALTALGNFILSLFIILFFSKILSLKIPPWEMSCNQLLEVWVGFLKMATFSNPEGWPQNFLFSIALVISRLLIPIQSTLFVLSLRNKFRR